MKVWKVENKKIQKKNETKKRASPKMKKKNDEELVKIRPIKASTQYKADRSTLA